MVHPSNSPNFSGKVVFLNLWATWCGPCRREIPELVRLHQEFQARGVEVIGLSTEDQEGFAEAVRDFVREYHMDYPVGWAPREVAGILMQERGSIPQSFIISETDASCVASSVTVLRPHRHSYDRHWKMR